MTTLNTELGARGAWRWLSLPVVDFVLFYCGLAAALGYRGSAPLDLRVAALFFPLILIWMSVLYGLEFYEPRVIRNFVSLVRAVLASAVMCVVLGMAYFYTLAPYMPLTPKRSLLLAVLASHVLIMLWRRMWLSMINYSLLDERLVFLADQVQVREIRKNLSGYFQDKGLNMVSWKWPGVDMIVADSRWVDEHWEEAREIFMAAVAHGVPVLSIESFYELFFGKVSPDYAANPSWALKFILPNTTGFYWRIKRACDVAGSALLLVLTAPLIAVTAGLMAITEGRPIFYGHVRAGLQGRPFTLWKFRTMTVGADKAGPLADANVRRSCVTAIGAVLRRFRLDELPQLWNVLRGDMSLVGPRPAEWSEEVEVLGKAVPGYHLRHLVYPGITGWAQLNFRAAYNVDDSLEKLHYDLYYVKYLSFSLDLSILLKTIKRVCINDLLIQVTPRAVFKTVYLSPNWARDLRALGRT